MAIGPRRDAGTDAIRTYRQIQRIGLGCKRFMMRPIRFLVSCGIPEPNKDPRNQSPGTIGGLYMLDGKQILLRFARAEVNKSLKNLVHRGECI